MTPHRQASVLFGRKPQADVAARTIPEDLIPTGTRAGGKGRATPSRKEAEAAARARAKVPRTRKEIAAANRLAQGSRSSAAAVKAAMKSGDERNYPVRDRGPVRHFVRDLVDARLGFIQLTIPLMLLSLVLGALASTGGSAGISSELQLLTVLLLAGDVLFLRWRVRREVERRFPGTSTKGLTYYAVSRAIYPKFLRRAPTMVPPGVKINERLPDTYR